MQNFIAPAFYLGIIIIVEKGGIIYDFRLQTLIFKILII
jgi:hypothetical protein